MSEEISHKEIYDRLVAVESKVDKVAQDTKDMVDAFVAAKGAFIVLEWLAKLAKLVLIVGAFFGAIWLAVENKLHQ
jgi:hypothetical protein